MTEIHIHADAPIIFVDGSYYVFHRYFATLRWYSFQKFKDVPKEEQKERIKEIHEEPEFVTAFFRHLEADLKKWRKKWEVPHGNIIFGFDCSRSDIWRNAHFNGYKESRTVSDNFNTAIFPIFYEWFRMNGDVHGIAKIEHERLEADDVIFLGTRQVLEMSATRIIVITNDNDYLQMRSDSIVLVNAQLVDIVARSSIGTPSQDLMMKVLMGDTSDNIPAVAPKLGPVTAQKLAMAGRAAVEEWAQQKGVVDRLRRNELLIDFRYIPSDLVREYREAHRWILV